jgi:hypothetical protein
MRGWSIRWCGRWPRNAATLAAWFERRMFHPTRSLEILGLNQKLWAAGGFAIELSAHAGLTNSELHSTTHAAGGTGISGQLGLGAAFAISGRADAAASGPGWDGETGERLVVAAPAAPVD